MDKETDESVQNFPRARGMSGHAMMYVATLGRPGSTLKHLDCLSCE